MTDIVERLRELEAVESELALECDCPPEATANYRYAMTCAEAADTITALRAEAERLKVEAAAQYADGAHDGSDRAQDLWAGEITALRAENERQRAALRDIIADSFSIYAIAVARAALEERP